MKKVLKRGYISYEDKKYSFVYEDNKLTLISYDIEQTVFPEYKHIELFDGMTLDGFNIVFYINNDVYYKDGCFICSPRCIFISQYSSIKITDMKFSALRISGGIINRFYSNKKMIKFDPKEDGFLKFKDIEDTITEETVNLNGRNLVFQLSITRAGWKDDGIITFNNNDSLLRLKYDCEEPYINIINDLNDIDELFKFCSNRVNISFDNIYLETKNEEDKYKKAAEIIIPYMSDIENNKDIIDYSVLGGHLNSIFKFLKECNYIFSIIPEDNKAFGIVTNKDYCAGFSCFESIYQHVHGLGEKPPIIKEEIALEEIKKELIPMLESVIGEYRGKDATKRKFAERFMNIISTANLKLEKCIYNEFEKHNYIMGSIYYKTREKIKEFGILDSIINAVKDRDDITHNKTIKLDEISIGMYEIVLKLNYAMIFEYVGIPFEIYSAKLNMLSLKNII